MTVTMDATFDGKAFIADDPVGLPPDTRVRLTIESVAEVREQTSFLKTALSLNLDGPANWSENYEDYLNAQRANMHE
ncbi:MAG TPA: hypothetical protein VGM51_02840 [Armatimonadota bacterium]|jgi:hypothetical protein